MQIDLEDLGLDDGGDLLVRRALRTLPIGGALAVRGSHPELPLHLRAWARGTGVGFHPAEDGKARNA